MTGIYLKCDKCGATLGGEEVTTKEHGLRWYESKTLIAAATELGWKCEPPDRPGTPGRMDYCPTCAKDMT